MRHARLPLLLLSLCLALAVHAQSVTTPVAPGLTYTAERVPEGPWEVRVLALERGVRYLGLDMALGMGRLQGVEGLSGIIARETAPEDTIVAAVNDDFFVMAPSPNAGLVSGLCVRRGELVMTARSHPAFVLMADGTPRIGVFNTTGTLGLPGGEVPLGGINQPPVKNGIRALSAIFGWPVSEGCVAVKMTRLPLQVNGEWTGTVGEIVPAGTPRQAAADEVLLQADGTAAPTLASLEPGDAVRLKLQTPGLADPVAMAAGGNLVLLRDGQIAFADNPRDPRHPRTLIGFNDRQIVIVTVDGRQAGWSVGMTYRELAALMLRLGCTDAINLDGGGSTTAWVRGQVVNRPSDGGERRIANAILVRSVAPHGPLARLVVTPGRIVALTGARVPLTLTGTDEWYNPVTLRPRDLTVTVAPGASRLSARLAEGALQLRGEPGEGVVRFSLHGAKQPLAELPVRLVESCARLEITPDPVELCAGERMTLAATGLTDTGEAVALPQSVQWRVEGTGLSLVGQTLRAGVAGTVGAIHVALGAATGTAPVRVASESVLEDCEGDFRPSFDRVPASGPATGSVSLHVGGAAQGRRYCRLNYDLGKPTGTRAAYIRLDRTVGAALRLSLQARATGDVPWVRVAVVDGNRTRQTFTLAEAVNWGRQWRRVQVRLPMRTGPSAGLKPPLTWQSVYVVATDGKTGRGTLEIDDLRVERVE